MATLWQTVLLEQRRDVDGLVELLLDDDPEVREQVAGALARLGATAATAVVALLLEDEDPTVRLAGARALEELGWRPRGGPEEAAWCAVTGRWAACIQLGEQAVPHLVRAAMEPEARHRLGAVQALAAIGTPSTRMPLLIALWDPSPELRLAAVRAFEGTRDYEILVELTRQLYEDDHDVRLATARLLLAVYTAADAGPAIKALIRGHRGVIAQPWYSEVVHVRARDPVTGQRCWRLVREDFGIGLTWPDEPEELRGASAEAER